MACQLVVPLQHGPSHQLRTRSQVALQDWAVRERDRINSKYGPTLEELRKVRRANILKRQDTDGGDRGEATSKKYDEPTSTKRYSSSSSSKDYYSQTSTKWSSSTTHYSSRSIATSSSSSPSTSSVAVFPNITIPTTLPNSLLPGPPPPPQVPSPPLLPTVPTPGYANLTNYEDDLCVIRYPLSFKWKFTHICECSSI